MPRRWAEAGALASGPVPRTMEAVEPIPTIQPSPPAPEPETQTTDNFVYPPESRPPSMLDGPEDGVPDGLLWGPDEG